MVIKMTDEYRMEAEAFLARVREKMEWVSEKNRDKIPYTTDENGNYDDRSDSGKNWNPDDGLNARRFAACIAIRLASASFVRR